MRTLGALALAVAALLAAPVAASAAETWHGTATGVQDRVWTIRLSAPDGAGASGGGGAGAGGAPTPSGNPPDRSLCTITGTRRADVLTGTPGPDVICAFGGNDVIRGRGGDDVIYAGSGKDRITPGGGKDTVSAGPGNDRISARDGKRDRIDGGRGRDRATIDRKLDKVTRVERRSGPATGSSAGRPRCGPAPSPCRPRGRAA